jgi:hypothetical protein
VTRDGTIAGVAGGLACLLAEVVTFGVRGPLGILNDFWIYWSAAAVLNAGGSAYDNAALARVHDAAGLPGITGGGYTYPLAFAEAMRPLAALPPWTAAAVFVGLSLVAVGVALALLLSSVRGLPLPAMLAIGILGGLYTPVSYGLWVGQANDLLLPALALAYRGVGPGATLALATAVKLYPAAGLLAVAGRPDRLRQAALAAVTAALLFLPDLLAGGRAAGRVAENLAADAYWSNQSLNGMLSRMALWDGWPLRGVAVEALDIAAVAALALLLALVLWRCRTQPWEGCLALCLCFGVVAAPKNSLWNFTPLLLCFAFGASRARERPAPAVALLVGLLLTGVQLAVWAASTPAGTVPDLVYHDPAGAALSSVGTFSALLVGAAVAALLLGQQRGPVLLDRPSALSSSQ